MVRGSIFIGFILFLLLLSLHMNSVSAFYRGMNLGGWLVVESWMTPSLYSNNGIPQGDGEWDFTQKLGKARAQQVLNTHWDTWIQQSDLQKLASHGITHLRVPVGYWIVDIQPNEPYVYGGLTYLKRLLGWAQGLNIGVIVDLHGAPGSQNGHDNSGKVGPIQWTQPQNVDRTITVLANLTQQLLGIPSVVGIEVLNEPWTTSIGGPIQFSTLKDFYVRAYQAIRAAGFKGDIWIPDGWDNNQWNGFMSPPNYYGVYLDVHLYHCFGGDRDKSDPNANIDYACKNDLPMLASLTDRNWSVVGEWSNCVSNPPGGGDFNTWVGKFVRAQWTAYGAAGPNPGSGPAKGAFFWNYKIDNGDAGWSYASGIDAGSMPSDFNFNGC